MPSRKQLPKKRQLRIAVTSNSFAVFFLMSGVLIASWGDCAKAQNITLDGTLGPAQTLTGPIYNINQAVGQTVGSNLFHSFGKFNLDAGERANFYSDSSIRNILTRVTGGSQSLINGLIYTDSARVNLFLINPSGIVFGPDARLDVGSVNRGSFVATTVDALVWSNSGRFSATNPEGSNSLLTIVGDPGGFLFSQRQPQPIVVRSGTSGLSVYPGQSLLLLGGDVSLDGGTLIAEGGRVELGGVAGEGTVGLSVNGNELRLNFPVGVPLSDVSLTNGTNANTSAGGGGSIAINARNLEILEESFLIAGIKPGLGTVDTQAGDIDINATEAIQLTNSSLILNAVAPEAVGKGGSVDIKTGSLFVTNGAYISASTFGQGNAGSVNIFARDTVSFDGGYAVSTVETLDAVGNGGDINITTGSLALVRGAQLLASTRGRGNAGSVNIFAHDTVSFDGVDSDGFPSAAFSSVEATGVGNGGGINITTGSLALTRGAQLQAETNGQGNAGSINIFAHSSVSFDGIGSTALPSAAFSSVEATGVGNGGDINIITGSLTVTGGAELQAVTRGRGNAGSVNIFARDTVFFDGVGSNRFASAAFSSVEATGVGNGGNINITTGSLAVTGGARLVASTLGRGNAGNVNIFAHGSVFFDGVDSYGIPSAVASTVEATGVGNSGNINITTKSLVIAGGAELQAATRGRGNAGSVNIFAHDTVSLDGVGSNRFPSAVASTVEATGVGNGGNINIITGSLSLTNGALLAASSQGQGDAGDIFITARDLLLNNQASIQAQTLSGNGGNITLNVQDLLLMRRDSFITTSAGTAQRGGDGGNMNINAQFIVAVPKEDSDITADAFTGRGGNINITTQGIYGLQYRPQQTPLSDITASSRFGVNGTVQINTPDVDPNRGLANLPENLVDSSPLIANSCIARSSQQNSSFTITGRGGLPPRPGDAFTSPYPTGTVRSIPSSSASSDTPSHSVEVNNPVRLQPFSQSNTAKETQGEAKLLVQGENVFSASPASTTPTPLVEATGWVYGANGEVILTAQAPTFTPHASWSKPISCQ